MQVLSKFTTRLIFISNDNKISTMIRQGSPPPLGTDTARKARTLTYEGPPTNLHTQKLQLTQPHLHWCIGMGTGSGTIMGTSPIPPEQVPHASALLLLILLCGGAQFLHPFCHCKLQDLQPLITHRTWQALPQLEVNVLQLFLQILVFYVVEEF